jgi:xanthine dehydrogenase accessory factor
MNETSREIAGELVRAANGGVPVAVATVVAVPVGASIMPGTKLLLHPDGTHLGGIDGGPIDAVVIEDAAEALTLLQPGMRVFFYRLDGSQVQRQELRESRDVYEVMVEVIAPPARLLIVGGGHIGLALATIGAQVGFSVAVLDDRQAYANPERFPMADEVLFGDIKERLAAIDAGSATYAVLVSRGHKQDETALRALVTRGCAYLGMIGSKRRVSTVLRHLAEEGYPLEALERVYTPIGLDIGAETPEEIAVAIMAEIIAVRRRGGSEESMKRDRPAIRPREKAPVED